jgi:hypothetical protein
MYTLVVHRSSETSTNQSDVIIRSDDRFLYLVVDSDSIVSKIYRLQFILCFFPSYWQTFCSFIPDVFFLILWQTSCSFVPAYFWHSVNTHIWTSLFSDRMMMSDWLVDVSDDRCTTNVYINLFSSLKMMVIREKIHKMWFRNK